MIMTIHGMVWNMEHEYDVDVKRGEVCRDIMQRISRSIKQGHPELADNFRFHFDLQVKGVFEPFRHNRGYFAMQICLQTVDRSAYLNIELYNQQENGGKITWGSIESVRTADWTLLPLNYGPDLDRHVFSSPCYKLTFQDSALNNAAKPLGDRGSTHRHSRRSIATWQDLAMQRIDIFFNDYARRLDSVARNEAAQSWAVYAINTLDLP